METQFSNILKIHKLSWAQYNQEVANGTVDQTALYIRPNELLSIQVDSGTTTTYDGSVARSFNLASASHTHGNITNVGKLGTASMVVVTDTNKYITTSSTISTTELGYLNNVTSNIQTQLNGKAPTSHGHESLTMPADTRAVATTCRDYNNVFSFVGLKQSSTIGLPSAAGNYGYLVGLCGWSDASGGATHELAFTDGGIYCRSGVSSWGAWSSLATKDLNGNIAATSFTASSDSRLKTNIKTYQGNKSILDLEVKSFDFIDGPKNQIGCIAQELQEICPELVTTDEKGYLSIQETKLIYLLLNEVKKLKTEIATLAAYHND